MLAISEGIGVGAIRRGIGFSVPKRGSRTGHALRRRVGRTTSKYSPWRRTGAACGGISEASQLGSSTTLVGGRWFWEQPNDIIHFGRVLSGSVQWPMNLATDIGCGAGVARFAATLSVSGQATGGTLTGCLDDTHLPFVFPPKIWGTLAL